MSPLPPPFACGSPNLTVFGEGACEEVLGLNEVIRTSGHVRRDARELCPSACAPKKGHVRTQQEGAACAPGKGLLSGTCSAGLFILDSQPPELGD